MKQAFKDRRTLFLVIVAALGYFVDIYDLVLFNVVKKESLLAIGLSGAELEHYDTSLFNWQMGGMLIGGLLWGILGDKRGRVQVLFGSIVLYSIANIANAFVDNTTSYAFWRVLAGIGLAGELGAGITLVVESMERTQRGWGTMVIVTFGALGGVVARLVGGQGAAWSDALGLGLQGWQMAYIVGGALGLVLLALRAGAFESGLFKKALESTSVVKGNFFMLFQNAKRAKMYIASVLIGLPIWFTVGVLINKSHVIGEALGVRGEVITGDSVMWSYIGLSIGDLFSGALSQWLQSRKKVVLFYLVMLSFCVAVYLLRSNVSLAWFHFMCLMLGASTGFWALFVTMASEQFGTNLRSTVTNTAPNFVRGATIPITLGFSALTPSLGANHAALVVGVICISISAICTLYVDETFHKDMDHVEL
ncbi:MAG: MFS transporter [Flavobacteriales bacterium]|nr:MFS transporter [Flavobacteriales bacterium]